MFPPPWIGHAKEEEDMNVLALERKLKVRCRRYKLEKSTDILCVAARCAVYSILGPYVVVYITVKLAGQPIASLLVFVLLRCFLSAFIRTRWRRRALYFEVLSEQFVFLNVSMSFEGAIYLGSCALVVWYNSSAERGTPPTQHSGNTMICIRDSTQTKWTGEHR